MAEEYGYKRSGKKCREKLDNLYKYYKKTKAAGGRQQEGKHYRFFRQLDALYGSNDQMINHRDATMDSHTATNKMPSIASTPNQVQHALRDGLINLSNSAGGGDDSSTDGDDDDNCSENEEEDKSLGTKIGELVDAQMRTFMEIQEAGLEKMMEAVDRMERDRLHREESWRNEEAARSDQQHRLWESERAWIKARDALLIEALEKISAKRLNKKMET